MLDEVELCSCSVQAAKFLKSSDRIVFCGTQPNGLSQLSIMRSTTNVKACVEGTFTYTGVCNNSLEVCELRNGLVIACANNGSNGEGNVVLCNMRSDCMGYSELNDISEALETLAYAPGSESCISALAFDEYNSILAHGKDNGLVICNDLTTGQITHQFNTDCSGVVNLSYKHASTLICTTRSSQYRMKVFDLRMADTQVIQVCNVPKHEVNSLDGYYTSLRAHKLNDTILVGTNTGDVLLWDMREVARPTANYANVHTDKGMIEYM